MKEIKKKTIIVSQFNERGFNSVCVAISLYICVCLMHFMCNYVGLLVKKISPSSSGSLSKKENTPKRFSSCCVSCGTAAAAAAANPPT